MDAAIIHSIVLIILSEPQSKVSDKLSIARLLEPLQRVKESVTRNKL